MTILLCPGDPLASVPAKDPLLVMILVVVAKLKAVLLATESKDGRYTGSKLRFKSSMVIADPWLLVENSKANTPVVLKVMTLVAVLIPCMFDVPMLTADGRVSV
jgi:hypothetical protein